MMIGLWKKNFARKFQSSIFSKIERKMLENIFDKYM